MTVTTLPEPHEDHELARMRRLFVAAFILFAHVAVVHPWSAAMLVGATALVWAGAEASARRRRASEREEEQPRAGRSTAPLP